MIDKSPIRKLFILCTVMWILGKSLIFATPYNRTAGNIGIIPDIAGFLSIGLGIYMLVRKLRRKRAATQSSGFATALREWTPVAERGDSDAQLNLGVMDRDGDGVGQDYQTAVTWFRLAAEQGYADAQSNLGVMYQNGQGVIQDNVYAHMWLNISRSNGSQNGGKLIEKVETRMTPSQIEKAQDLARACVAKNYKGC